MSIGELKPCPFCGGRENLRVCHDKELGHYVVECSPAYRKPKCTAMGPWAPTRDGAIAGWNRRVGSSDETTAKPQAPIARITVKADRCYAAELYAPGLPAGVHDLYCEPEAVAPMLREKRAYYETHDPPHCPTCDCEASPSKASERPAAVAHGMRHCPTCGEELGEDGHHKPDPVPPLI